MLNPLKFLSRKKKEGEEQPPAEESASPEGESDGTEEKTEKKASERKSTAKESTNPEITKIYTEIDRLGAGIESFGEVRKSMTERISQMSEQIGELRAMIMDRDRTIQEVELKAIKASDLVETVQPEKLMIEIQKEDAKFEALKANLEGNESIMDRVMEEMREMRKKLEFFRGIEEVIKLSEEVRKELIEIKKTEATIGVNTEKVQTMYTELRKKFQEIDVFRDSLQELRVNVDQNLKDVDVLKSKVVGLADKEELNSLVQKVERYIESLKEVSRNSTVTKDVAQLKKMLDTLG